MFKYLSKYNKLFLIFCFQCLNNKLCMRFNAFVSFSFFLRFNFSRVPSRYRMKKTLKETFCSFYMPSIKLFGDADER